MSEQQSNILLNNRRAFTARQSMDALINFARYLHINPESKTKKSTKEANDSNTANP